MNETNIDKIKGNQLFDDAEKGIGGEPPIIKYNLMDYWVDPSDYKIHFYIKYEYFPIKNFGTFNKSVNELYELVYYILYNEQVNRGDTLVLEIAKTGNSIDVLMALVDKLNPSKRAKKVMAIVIALITALEVYDNHSQKLVENRYTEAKIIAKEADAEKTKAEASKTLQESKKAELENILLKNKIGKDSIDLINTETNRKKINRKQTSIQRSLMQKPITQTVINGTVIYNNISIDSQSIDGDFVEVK